MTYELMYLLYRPKKTHSKQHLYRNTNTKPHICFDWIIDTVAGRNPAPPGMYKTL